MPLARGPAGGVRPEIDGPRDLSSAADSVDLNPVGGLLTGLLTLGGQGWH